MSGFGAALAVLGLGHLILPLTGEAYEWAQYLLAGAVFPAVLFAVHHLFHLAMAERTLEIFRWISALAAVAFCFFLIPAADLPLLSGFALASWFLLGGAKGLSAVDWKKTGASLFALAAICAVWGLFFRLAPAGRFLGAGAQQVLAAFLAVVFALWYWPHYAFNRGALRMFSAPRVLLEIAPITVLALAAFRVPYSINENHEFFAGGAALVRQGGWLLWDVPSQYGFLNILLVAAMPFKSPHFSLYVAASALQLVCALVMYGMVRGLRGDVFGAAAGMFFTVTMAFMVSGGTPFHTGLNTFPSTGGMRFLFCYLLLAWSYWNIVSENGSGGARTARFFTGSFIVAAGCLWSAESLVYSLSVWLPQSIWLSWETAKRRDGAGTISLPLGVLPVFLSSLLPPLILFAAVNGCYLAGLGHLPDWYAFIEFAMAYKGGFGAFPIDPRGGVWGLLLLFAAVAVCAAAAFRDRLAAWPALVGIMGLFWSTSSYFVSRSIDSNILNLVPLHVTCAVAAMAAFRDKPVHRLTLWAALIPLTGVLFIVTWGNPNLHRFFSETFRTDHHAYIDTLLPKAGKPFGDILKDVGYKNGDPVVVVNDMMPPLMADAGSAGQGDDADLYRLWLPMAPASQFLLLPPERQLVYISRFARRHRQGGWLVVPHKIPTENVDGFFAAINAEYRPTFQRHNEEWLAMRYEPR